MKIPEPNRKTIEQMIDEHHEKQQGGGRMHLGCSQLGDPCDRRLWLNFRWATPERFSGRMLRLFRRGHNEEQIIINDLRAIGIHITDTGAAQSRVDFGKHVSGSIDGKIHYGVPEAPRKQHIAEFKTHSLKSFTELEKKGVKESKPQHYDQMQCYMLGTKIDRALYVAVCKDNDKLHIERVKLDKAHAEKLIKKGHRITMAERMPEPISADPSWYQCKFCPSSEFCHQSKLTTEVNCRTCAHSTPKEDSTFFCERWQDTIPKTTQKTGCRSHVIHPDMVPWKMLDSDYEWSATYSILGKSVVNGEDGLASSEIIANPKQRPA